MKKCFFLPALLSSVGAFAQSNSTNTQAAPEEDLYRQNQEVFSVHPEFLYWTVRENVLDYAIVQQNPEWGPTDFYANGHYKKAHFSYDPGFRVSISYFKAPMYEIWAQYTWLYSHSSDSAFKPAQDDLFLDSTWPSIPQPLLSAHTNVKLHYNLGDVFFTRVFIPNSHLRLRILGGITGTWMNQDWNIKYNSEDYQSNIKNKWDFWGVGFRAGSTVDWFLEFTEIDLYLTAKATAAILLGRYHNHGLQRTTFQPEPTDMYNTSVPIRNAYYEDTRAAYQVQFLVGPSWQKNFDSCRVEVFAGYEMTAWFNVLEVFRSVPQTPPVIDAPGYYDYAQQTIQNNGVMSLDGLTVRFTVDF